MQQYGLSFVLYLWLTLEKIKGISYPIPLTNLL